VANEPLHWRTLQLPSGRSLHLATTPKADKGNDNTTALAEGGIVTEDDGPYCFCGHSEGSHKADGSFCYGCQDAYDPDDPDDANPNHLYEIAGP
jgi:hypothetical protein